LVKIIFLTSRFPYPLEKGDKLRAFKHLEALSAQHEVHLISLSHSAVTTEDFNIIQKYCSSVKVFRIFWWDILYGMLWALVKSKPFSVGYFYKPTLVKSVASEIESLKADVLYCQLIRMAPYAETVKMRKVIDYMDSFSLIAKRRTESSFGILHFLFKKEAKLLSKYEKQLQERFEKRIFISKVDKNSLFPEDPDSIVITNGIDVSYFNPEAFKAPKTFDIAFVGNMGYHPNINAARFLVKEILPKLPKGTKVLIAGARPTKEVKRFASPAVTVSGFIKDIRTSYASSNLFMAPIFHGAGQQNKILEAMSMGIPCITTSQVNEAIGAIHGESILVADTPDQYLAAFKRLKDPLFRDNLVTRGRAFVANHYPWEKVNKELNNVFN